MKGSVVKTLFCKRSHTGKALYLLSDLILIHAELGHGNMVEKPTSAVSQLNFPTPFCVFFTKKEKSTSFPVVLKSTQEKQSVVSRLVNYFIKIHKAIMDYFLKPSPKGHILQGEKYLL